MIALLVSGCGVLPEGAAPVSDVTVGADIGGDVPRPQARPDDLSVPGASVDEAAPEPEVSIGTLGRTVVSLGNPGEPGLWLKTPLVSAERSARLFNPATDKSVEVTLIPIEGPSTAGSRASIATMQALGASLADLVEVDVFGF